MCITVYTSGIFRLKLSQAKFAKTQLSYFGITNFGHTIFRIRSKPTCSLKNHLYSVKLCCMSAHVLLFQIDIMCQIRTGAILTSLQNDVYGVTGGTYANTCRLQCIHVHAELTFARGFQSSFSRYSRR